MPYLDITPNQTEWRTDGAGDWELTNREVDIAADVLLTGLGGFKYAPLVGGRARSFLNSTTQKAVIERVFKVAMKTAGFSRPIVDVTEFPDKIGVNNDEILL